jgi:serine/threonine-protein kinase
VIEVCSHHLHTPPEPPSRRLGRAVPAKLEAVILSCLEKDPGRRPQSAAALSAALLACDDTGSWGEREALEWWGRHRSKVDGICCGRTKCHDTMNVDLDGRLADSIKGDVPSSSAIH